MPEPFSPTTEAKLRVICGATFHDEETLLEPDACICCQLREAHRLGEQESADAARQAQRFHNGMLMLLNMLDTQTIEYWRKVVGDEMHPARRAQQPEPAAYHLPECVSHGPIHPGDECETPEGRPLECCRAQQQASGEEG